jgi:low affinity Fe/Cu permease
MEQVNEAFRIFAKSISNAMGSSWAFLTALVVVVVWAITGPIFNYSQTWQLIINTGTTIVTFLMVFILQNTQNREAKATQLKLDDLIEAQKRTHKHLIGAEEESDEELERDKKEIEKKDKKKKKK